MTNLMRAREMRGLRVVNVESAEELGVVDGVAYSSNGLEVLGVVLEPGVLAFGQPDAIPWDSVRSIGPDAVMVDFEGQDAASRPAADALEDQIGAGQDVEAITVFGAGGARLGRLADLVVDADDGRIVAYEIEDDEGVREDRPAFVLAPESLSISADALVLPESLEAELLDDLGEVMRRTAGNARSRAQARESGSSRNEQRESLRELTRDELYDKARDAEIPGRSKMTKEQLVAALVGDQT